MFLSVGDVSHVDCCRSDNSVGYPARCVGLAIHAALIVDIIDGQESFLAVFAVDGDLGGKPGHAGDRGDTGYDLYQRIKTVAVKLFIADMFIVVLMVVPPAGNDRIEKVKNAKPGPFSVQVDRGDLFLKEEIISPVVVTNDSFSSY